MKRSPVAILVAMLATICAVATFGQMGGYSGMGMGGGGGGAALQPIGGNFSVDNLVAMIGYFLPAQEFQFQGTNRRGSQANENQRGDVSFQIPRVDPKYHLSSDQIDTLLATLEALHENTYPSPAKGKRMQKDVEETLTKDQKREWDKYVKELQKRIEDIQRQGYGQSGEGGGGYSQSGEGGGGQAMNFMNMSEEEREELIENLPEEQRERIEQMLEGGGGMQMQNFRMPSPEEIRQRSIENLIQRMEEFKKTS